MMTLETKHCNGCGEDKELSEYYFYKTGRQIGTPLSHCKTCICIRKAAWKKANPDKVTAERHNWRKANPEKVRKSSRDCTYRKGAKPAAENRSCATYLGCVIAETVLAHEFPGFKRMPNGNPNYDYDCPKGYKIDVKSSCKRHSDNRTECWNFTIRRNKVANYFLFLAFGNRDEPLTPKHLWLVPGDVVNEKMNITITDSPRSLAKWSQFERPLDNVLNCCNQLVSNETLWDRYQKTQEFSDLTRYLKHAAWLRIDQGIKDE